ncbi:SDR family NAD(P)-dependent oxidoreductase [Streptosporangium oxazolinicum]|uniref:SDR family NAD(P)-dependent oxidoreductase n=1 Tax=Streptosporangium oxazolinicum TaxID=909287 RepID=A0ABP8B1W2_9ACTN
MPTAVLIGAGPGLGLAMARRFGRGGYTIALISRDPARHDDAVRELAGLGIEAAAFAVDVRDTAGLGEALGRVEREFGAIDLVYYGPSPHSVAEARKPIEEITGSDVEEAMALVYPAADVVARTLPSMRERRTGAFLFTSAISAVVPVPQLGAMTVPASAARTYAVTLNAALAPHGVYAGVLLIGGLIEGSDIHAAMSSAGESDSAYLLDPDRTADIAWDMVARRKSPEALIMPGRRGLGLTLLLIARLLRVTRRSGRSPCRR